MAEASGQIAQAAPSATDERIEELGRLAEAYQELADAAAQVPRQGGGMSAHDGLQNWLWELDRVQEEMRRLIPHVLFVFTV